MGSGGPRGLQNRSGPTTSGWVGSIPTRSRHRGNLSRSAGSHLATMPPCRLLPLLFAFALALVCAATPARAQQADSARAGVAPVLAPRSAPAAAVAALADSLRPPITPGRAFLYSFLVPGAGQARLDRPYAGAMFFLIEVSSLALVHRSAEDLRIARRFAGDSVPLRYQLDAATGRPVLGTDGAPQVAEWRVPRYDEAYVRTRRLHYEDWIAVVLFNHLFAGADAFVAAQLWDLPGKVAVRQTPFGPLIQATVSFR